MFIYNTIIVGPYICMSVQTSICMYVRLLVRQAIICMNFY